MAVSSIASPSPLAERMYRVGMDVLEKNMEAFQCQMMEEMDQFEDGCILIPSSESELERTASRLIWDGLTVNPIRSAKGEIHLQVDFAIVWLSILNFHDDPAWKEALLKKDARLVSKSQSWFQLFEVGRNALYEQARVYEGIAISSMQAGNQTSDLLFSYQPIASFLVSHFQSQGIPATQTSCKETSTYTVHLEFSPIWEKVYSIPSDQISTEFQKELRRLKNQPLENDSEDESDEEFEDDSDSDPEEEQHSNFLKTWMMEAPWDRINICGIIYHTEQCEGGRRIDVNSLSSGKIGMTTAIIRSFGMDVSPYYDEDGKAWLTVTLR